MISPSSTPTTAQGSSDTKHAAEIKFVTAPQSTGNIRHLCNPHVPKSPIVRALATTSSSARIGRLDQSDRGGENVSLSEQSPGEEVILISIENASPVATPTPAQVDNIMFDTLHLPSESSPTDRIKTPVSPFSPFSTARPSFSSPPDALSLSPIYDDAVSDSPFSVCVRVVDCVRSPSSTLVSPDSVLTVLASPVRPSMHTRTTLSPSPISQLSKNQSPSAERSCSSVSINSAQFSLLPEASLGSSYVSLDQRIEMEDAKRYKKERNGVCCIFCCGLRFSEGEIEEKYLAFRYGVLVRVWHALVSFGLAAVVCLRLYFSARDTSLGSYRFGMIGYRAVLSLLMILCGVLMLVNRRPRLHDVFICVSCLSAYLALSVLTPILMTASGKPFVPPHSYLLEFGQSPAYAAFCVCPRAFVFGTFFVAWIPLGLFGILGRLAAPTTVLNLPSDDTSFLAEPFSSFLYLLLFAVFLVVLERQSRRIFESKDRLARRERLLTEERESLCDLMEDLLPRMFWPIVDRIQESSVVAHYVVFRKSVVLWADIEDFTSWCQTVPIGVVVSFLNELSASVDSFCRLRPFLSRYMNVGDAVCCFCEEQTPEEYMCVFRLGVRMICLCRKRKVRLRVGIACGESILTCVGCLEGKVGFDVYGDGVTRAEGLEEAATPGSVSLDEVLYSEFHEQDPSLLFSRNESGNWECPVPLSRQLLSPCRPSPKPSSAGSFPSSLSKTIAEPESRTIMSVLLRCLPEPLLPHRRLVFGLPIINNYEDEVSSCRVAVHSSPFLPVCFRLLSFGHHLVLLSILISYQKWELFVTATPALIGLYFSLAMTVILMPFSLSGRRSLSARLATGLLSALSFRLFMVLIIVSEICGDFLWNFSDAVKIGQITVLFYSSWPWPCKASFCVFDAICFFIRVCSRPEESLLGMFREVATWDGFCLFLLVITWFIDRVSKLSYLRELKTRQREEELLATNRKAELLAHSILPRNFCQMLQRSSLEGYSVQLDFTFVAFISLKFKDDVSFGTISEVENWFHPLAAIFCVFTDLMKRSFGVTVKTIGSSYLATTVPSATPAQMQAFVRGLFDCRRVSSESSEFLGISIGLGMGHLGGGVIGSTHHRFDCFGHAVNTAARLSRVPVFSRRGILVVTDQLKESNVPLSATSVGCHNLKGIGVVECSIILEED